MPSSDIRIGDYVRSFDHEGLRDSFCEGVVKAVGVKLDGCSRYEILVSRVVEGGRENIKSRLVGQSIFPPLNGVLRIPSGKLTSGVEWCPVGRSGFDAFEIHPCVVVGLGEDGKPILETCDPESDRIDMWSVYGHLPHGGIECVGDFPSEAAAQSYRDLMDFRLSLARMADSLDLACVAHGAPQPVRDKARELSAFMANFNPPCLDAAGVTPECARGPIESRPAAALRG